MSEELEDRRLPVTSLVILGVIAGLLSGLFGVGGGFLIVPMLMMLGISQRMAAGTSVAAILPTAIVGAAGYGVSGNVDWIASVILAVGVVVGAQLGSLLLSRISRSALFWSFLAFLGIVIVSLWIVIPDRAATIDMNLLTGAGLLLAGLIVGVLSGLLGVGGGIILVPVLMLVFGASDLIAKGSSLLMMVPGSVSATLANRRRGTVDLRHALWIGLSACAVSPLGIWGATLISPFWSNVAFSLLLTGVAVQMLVRHLRTRA